MQTSISGPLDYEKSVLTSRPERCAKSRKSATGICRYITPPNPSKLWRRISVGLELRHCKCWLPWSQGCVNMLQGQTYTVMFPFTSTSLRNFVAYSDHAGSPNVKDHKSSLHANSAVGQDRSRVPQITRKASWPLAQRGALNLINPPRVFAVTILYIHLCTPI